MSIILIPGYFQGCFRVLNLVQGKLYKGNLNLRSDLWLRQYKLGCLRRAICYLVWDYLYKICSETCNFLQNIFTFRDYSATRNFLLLFDFYYNWVTTQFLAKKIASRTIVAKGNKFFARSCKSQLADYV